MDESRNISTYPPLSKPGGMRRLIEVLSDVYSQAEPQDQASLDSSANSFIYSLARYQAFTPSSFDELSRTLNNLTSGLWDMSFPNVELSGTGQIRSPHSPIKESLLRSYDAVILMRQQILKIISVVNMTLSSQTNSSPSPEI